MGHTVLICFMFAWVHDFHYHMIFDMTKGWRKNFKNRGTQGTHYGVCTHTQSQKHNSAIARIHTRTDTHAHEHTLYTD